MADRFCFNNSSEIIFPDSGSIAKMKTKQTKKRVSYRLSNDVVEMINTIKQETGKTATEIVEESIRNEDGAYKLARLLSEKG